MSVKSCVRLFFKFIYKIKRAHSHTCLLLNEKVFSIINERIELPNQEQEEEEVIVV